MMDIEINAWPSLFLNIETNLILYLYPEKFIELKNVELTSTFLLYIGLVYHHHEILNYRIEPIIIAFQKPGN